MYRRKYAIGLYDLERILEDTAIQDYHDRKSWSSRIMDVDKIAMFAGIGFAIVVGLFVLWGPSPRPRRRRGRVVGINNLGYTCFLNSLLQALAACPTFTSWLDEQREKKDKNFTKTLFSVLSNLQSQINGSDEDLYGNVMPNKIISSLGLLWNFGPGQQDAHELLHVILNALEAEMQPVNRNGSLSDALNLRNTVSCNDIASAEKESHRPGMIVARSSELRSRNGEYKNSIWSFQSLFAMAGSNTMSVETHPFSGLITNQLQCSDCKCKSSVRYDKFETLSLALPIFKSDRHTLEKLLAHFVDNELVHDVQCDRCTSRCTALKTLSLGKLPKCLCLHISRTHWSSLLTKRDDQVIFPQTLVLDPYTYTETKRRNAQGDMKYLDIDVDLAPEGKHKYQLCAVIEHRGPVDSGHFVCFRQGNKTGQWLYTSDAVVENVTLTQVLLANPYMLFYVKSSQQPS